MAGRTARASFPLTLTQTILIAIGLFAIFVAVDLGQNEPEYQSAVDSQATFQAQVSLERTRQVELAATLTFVQSDNYVEQYFRNEAGMVREDEVRIVPTFIEPTPSPTPVPEPTPDPISEARPWQFWWRLVSDSPPPTR